MSRPTPETDAFAASEFVDKIDELTQLYDLSEKLERERDEAMEERDQLKQLLAADSENVDAYLGVCIERDEAREEAHRFRSLHYSHLGINGSASRFPWETK